MTYLLPATGRYFDFSTMNVIIPRRKPDQWKKSPKAVLGLLGEAREGKVSGTFFAYEEREVKTFFSINPTFSLKGIPSCAPPL
jgi:hypothetical protein